MKETDSILLGTRNDKNPEETKTGHIVIGTMLLISGLISVFAFKTEAIRLIIGSSLNAVGLFSFFFARIAFAISSKYAPKITISNQYLEITESVWRKPEKIDWKNLEKIHFTSSRIEFKGLKFKKTIDLHSSKEIQFEINELLKRFIISKNIQVNIQ
jgi:hypothetical protein